MSKKLVVITGASSGFGAEMAKLFHKLGHPLLLIARRIEMIDALNLQGDNILIERVDVSNFLEFEKAIRKAEAKFGETDLLINNAGVMLLGNVTTQSPIEWKTMLDTNVLGVLNGTKIVLENMIKRESGTIINVSSIAGFKAFTDHAAYVATKFGVHGLSETIRQEVADKNVRIALISPGAAETELLTHVSNPQSLTNYNDWKKSMGGMTLDPKHIAECAAFIYNMPQSVNIREITLATTKQIG